MNADKYEKLTRAYKKTKRRKQTENEGDMTDASEYPVQVTKDIDTMLYNHVNDALSLHHNTEAEQVMEADWKQSPSVMEYHNETIERLTADIDENVMYHTKDQGNGEDMQHNSDGDGVALHSEESDAYEYEDDEGKSQDNFDEDAFSVEDDRGTSSPVADSELAIYTN